MAFALIKVSREPVQKDVAAPSVLNGALEVKQGFFPVSLTLVQDEDVVPPWDKHQLFSNLLNNLPCPIHLKKTEAISQIDL